MAGNGGKRGANEDKFLTPAVIGLYILIIGVILLMVYFVYTQIMKGMEDMPERTTPPMPTVTSPMAYYTTSATGTSPAFSMYEPEETTSSLIVTKAQTTTPAPVTSPDPNESEIDIESISGANNYDPKYFAGDLFIGDSIMTGLSGYGYIPAEQVFAKIGLNPSTALTESVGEYTLLQKVGAMQPIRVYIMLGSNGIAFLSASSMAEYMAQLCDEIQTASPGADICIVTIPPVTAAYEANLTEYSVSNADINEYNALLKTVASDNGYTLIDLHSRLADGDGFLSDKYAEADGMHFLGDAYAAMLSMFQSITE
jgi:lysophospholipase L1-like esterase